MKLRSILFLGVVAFAGCGRADRPAADAAPVEDSSTSVCEVSALRCVEGTIEVCDGASWTVSEVCEEGCLPANEGAQCVSCDACGSSGATECLAGTTRSCIRASSGCLEWSANEACESGTCADGSRCAPPVLLPPGTLRRSQTFGADGLDFARDVAKAPDGSIVIVGYFENTVDFGGGPLESVGAHDVFVARYDSAGGHVWSRAFGGTDNDEGLRVTVNNSGDVIVAGTSRGSVDSGGVELGEGLQFFFVRFDADGVPLDSRGSRGGAGSIEGIASAPNGDVLLTGRISGPLDFGGGELPALGGWDIFLARFTAAGEHVWSRRYGSEAFDFATGVAADVTTGDIVVTGVYRGPVDFGGGELAADGPNAMFLARFNADGGHLWSRGIEGDGVSPAGVSIDRAGAITVTGSFGDTVVFGGDLFVSRGSDDMFLVRYRADGGHIWSQSFGGSSPESPRDIAVDAEGIVTVVGSFGSNAVERR